MAHVEGPGDARGVVERMDDPSGAPVVKLLGAIDISNAESLGVRLDQLIGDETHHLVVYLGALEFMNSSGTAMLLKVAGRIGTINIRNPSDSVQRIIVCSGLTD